MPYGIGTYVDVRLLLYFVRQDDSISFREAIFNAYEIIVTEIRLPLFQIPFEAFSKGVRKDAPSMLFYLDFYSVDINNNTCVRT